MNESRRKILDMLSAGQITVEEAERLMAALEKEPPASGAGNGPQTKAQTKLKYLRVVVTGEDKHGHPLNVNVRVPMQLLRAGVKLASLIPAQARDHVIFALHKEGVPIDLNKITPENLEEVIENLNELTVNVDDPKTKVRVFCE